MLDLLAGTIVELLGFGVAAVNVARPDRARGSRAQAAGRNDTDSRLRLTQAEDRSRTVRNPRAWASRTHCAQGYRTRRRSGRPGTTTPPHKARAPGANTAGPMRRCTATESWTRHTVGGAASRASDTEGLVILQG
jgi:hypothetical protein